MNVLAKMFVAVVAVALTVGLCLALAEAPRKPAALTFPPERGEVLVLPIEAVDGDTVEFFYLVRARARLHGINAPEKTGATAAAGKASREFLQGKLPKEPTGALLLGREKYGRLLMRLYDADGEDLSEVMIKAGHAKPWDGKGPRP
jgi:endonuclease YncB( thermonuclease family)